MASQPERMARMEQSLEDIKATVLEVRAVVKGQDNRFAGKWVEWAVRSLIGAVIMVMTYVVASLVTGGRVG